MGPFARDWTKRREQEVLSCKKLEIVAVLSVVTFTMSLASNHHVTQK